MVGDLPTFAGTSPAHLAYGLNDLANANFRGAQLIGAIPKQAQEYNSIQSEIFRLPPPEETPMKNPSRRLVKVIIADPNENIPLDKCVLFTGEEKLTDLNDQELFFELDVKSMLSKHNEERVKIVDKKVKERTEYLEPAKIRDLKMVVVTIAEF